MVWVVKNLKVFHWKKLTDYILNHDIFDVFKTYFFPFYEPLIIVCFALLFIFLGVLFFKKIKISILTVAMGVSLILFFLLYDFIFHIFVNWPSLNNWYYIVLNLHLNFFVVFALKELLSFFLKIKKKRILYFLPITIFFFYACYLQILAIKNQTQFKYPYNDSSMEKVYNFLAVKGNPNDISMDFSLGTISARLIHARLQTYRSKTFFHNLELPKLIKYKKIKIDKTLDHKSFKDNFFIVYYIDKNLFLKKGTQKLFLVTHNNFPFRSDKSYGILSSVMEGLTFGKYAVFELSFKEENKEKEYINFLFDLIEKTPKNQRPVLHETLLYYACKNKNINQFNQLLKGYIGLKPFLNETSPYNDFPDYFFLERRVKYFKNINCNKI